jgi:hypothetical protein
MSAFTNAVTELIAASSRPMAWDDTQEAARTVCAQLPGVGREQIDHELARLREPIRVADIPTAGILALCCGAMVEAGGNPELTISEIADKLPDATDGARKFVDACRAAADADNEQGAEHNEYAGDPVADFGDQVRSYYTEAANAYYALDPLGLGAIAMMSRSPDVRKHVRAQHPVLLNDALALAPYHERASFLATMLRVLDHEPLVAIHPGLHRGYLLEMVGIATNFELFILLGDVLIGDPAGGWLPGERPDPRVGAACRDSPVVAGADSAVGAFNVWNWTGLRADGTLPAGEQRAGSEHWVWMEGLPADIEPFHGQRIVLLGPPPYVRIIPAGRCFRDMTADLRVTRALAHAEVEAWLARLSNAPRARIV